jgi:pyruvate,orthophosphate dikinase
MAGRIRQATRHRRAPARETSRTKTTRGTRARGDAPRPATRRLGHSYVFVFGGGRADGSARLRELLGGKGANLAEMARLGLPVPPGFTITTEVCSHYYAHGRRYPTELGAQVTRALARLEQATGRRFGSRNDPLLVSVRSGARVSMPGMMDTILNLGLNDETVEGLIRQSGDPRFAYDSYRRFVQMYGDVVLGLKPESERDPDPFEERLEARKRRRGVRDDVALGAEDLRDLVVEFKALIRARRGIEFPEDPEAQLWGAIGAVFGSWQNARAVTYRKLYGIPGDWGTAVNVQAMVFGNLGAGCATGVAFTRDPATGERALYGEFLLNAQGEDVVAGSRTPQQISLEGARRWAREHGMDETTRAARHLSLEETMPDAYRQLLGVCRTLERHYHDMQDLEFTIEKGRLFMLQCRVGKRTGLASVRIAVDMVRERLIDEREALRRVEPRQLDQLLQPVFDPVAKEAAIRDGRRLARGLNAGPGAATGRVVFSAGDAERWAARGDPVILTRVETSPEDIRGMTAAVGILTARGGMTSHAALVARQMGKVCVAGCEELAIDYTQRRLAVGGHTLTEGDWLSIDGTTGEVFLGEIRTHPSEVMQVVLHKTLAPRDSKVYSAFADLLRWCDRHRRLKVRTNADLPDQATLAIALGAEGIGLCRTEHMFFEGDRIDAVREMILADDLPGRERALAKLLPMQKGDFVGIFRAMAGRPVTIRLLDPPLHEFLPHTDAELAALAGKIGVPTEQLRAKRDTLHEANPMLGHRGCRLGITFPEIYRMQVRAIMEAACELAREGHRVVPEIMIPLVGLVRELEDLRAEVERVAAETMTSAGVRVRYTIGTMIEVPRAALVADAIAAHADFFSFGTNDLTQLTLGLSRDDAGKFLPEYVDRQIISDDPFAVLDIDGVGTLIGLAVQKGRTVRPALKVGICGEHGGEPTSVRFCHGAGLDYVSCSPYRVPVARLAAARAALGL